MSNQYFSQRTHTTRHNIIKQAVPLALVQLPRRNREFVDPCRSAEDLPFQEHLGAPRWSQVKMRLTWPSSGRTWCLRRASRAFRCVAGCRATAEREHTCNGRMNNAQTTVSSVSRLYLCLVSWRGFTFHQTRAEANDNGSRFVHRGGDTQTTHLTIARIRGVLSSLFFSCWGLLFVADPKMKIRCVVVAMLSLSVATCLFC